MISQKPTAVIDEQPGEILVYYVDYVSPGFFAGGMFGGQVAHKVVRRLNINTGAIEDPEMEAGVFYDGMYRLANQIFLKRSYRYGEDALVPISR